MKAAFKWRLENGIYGYITDEQDNGSFIFNVSSKEREYSSGLIVTGSSVNDNAISTIVSKMPKEQYIEHFNAFKDFISSAYPSVSLLDVTYYYNIENDECIQSASSLKCSSTDILFYATAVTGDTVNAEVTDISTSGDVLEYRIDFTIPQGEQGPVGITPDIEIGSVETTTLAPTEDANVTVTRDPDSTDEEPVFNFQFEIPRGLGIDADGNLTANTISAATIISDSIVISGGTDTQYLMADGSVTTLSAGTNVTITKDNSGVVTISSQDSGEVYSEGRNITIDEDEGDKKINAEGYYYDSGLTSISLFPTPEDTGLWVIAKVGNYSVEVSDNPNNILSAGDVIVINNKIFEISAINDPNVSGDTITIFGDLSEVVLEEGVKIYKATGGANKHIVNIASGKNSFAQGSGTIACGENSHAEGSVSVVVYGECDIRKGPFTVEIEEGEEVIEKVFLYVELNDSITDGNTGFIVEGDGTTVAFITESYFDGDERDYFNVREEDISRLDTFISNPPYLLYYQEKTMDEYYTISSGYSSHAEGVHTVASGTGSHAEGRNTIASGEYSHAEGRNTIASGEYSHTEGFQSKALSGCSHAEGFYTTASGYTSHAEGSRSKALGVCSHAEGDNTTASDYTSHAEGFNTIASGWASHAGGRNTIANLTGMTAIGQFNKSGVTDEIFVVGNGGDIGKRKNALTVHSGGTDTVTATVNGIEDVQLGLPIGSITMWAGESGETVPSGWLLCDGSRILYSTGDTSGNYNVLVTKDIHGVEISKLTNLLGIIGNKYNISITSNNYTGYTGDHYICKVDNVGISGMTSGYVKTLRVSQSALTFIVTELTSSINEAMLFPIYDPDDPNTYKFVYQSEGNTVQITGVTNPYKVISMPDLRQRFPIGVGSGTIGEDPTNPNNGYPTGLGSTGGEPTHVLSAGELNHWHERLDTYGNGSHGAYGYSSQPSGALTGSLPRDREPSVDITPTGHNNIPPFLALNFIIKYK